MGLILRPQRVLGVDDFVKPFFAYLDPPPSFFESVSFCHFSRYQAKVGKNQSLFRKRVVCTGLDTRLAISPFPINNPFKVPFLLITPLKPLSY